MSSNITLKNEQGKPIKATWNATSAGDLELKVPLKDESPGKISMQVEQYGSAQTR